MIERVLGEESHVSTPRKCRNPIGDRAIWVPVNDRHLVSLHSSIWVVVRVLNVVSLSGVNDARIRHFDRGWRLEVNVRVAKRRNQKVMQ